jgi:hypothetical protein
MTTQNTSQSTSAIQSSVVKEAALIANFYGERGHLQDLIDCLVQSLALTPQPQGHNSYANTVTGALLRHFDPPAASAHDTTIIQMALNTPGAAEAAWKALREQLEAILPNDDLLKRVWGYTLIYQADLAQDTISNDALAPLLLAVRRLHPALSEHPQTLAESDMPGGRLWLIDIPLQGNGLQAATVYLALSQPNSNNLFVQDVLYNPVAALLMVDLIAHKGYHQMRQYRLGGLDVLYRYNMETLSTHTDTLLHDLTGATVTAGELDNLASEYGLLVSAVVHLDQLHVSLLRQQFNFNWWRKQAGSGDVVEYHHSQLENAAKELELLVAEGQHPLEAANTAVDMMRARSDKQQEAQQQRIETILAAAAAVLSVLVLIDKETAQALLELVRVPQPIGIWHELGVQALFIVVFSLVAMLVVSLVRKSQGPK